VSKPFDPLALIRKVRCLVEQARGAPLPMVILDGQRRLHDAGRLRISSIDAAVVQQMFGDDQSLFESLLVRLLRDYADLALPISVLPADETARIELKRRAHKLKGSAGMIGATSVARLAGAAETALQQNRPAEEVLRKLAAALTTLREEAQPWLERQSGREADTCTTTDNLPSIGDAGLEELHALIQSQNLSALDKFSALSRQLSNVLGAERFEQLRRAMDNLDFSLGADLLQATLRAGKHERDLKAG
jgi:HPt (histidine-containing phosphotransfer) domain-containing protein